MSTIIKLIDKHGLRNARGKGVKVHNEPFMPLTIENIGTGPTGAPAFSVCHYGEQNGDLMRDPEICVELRNEELTPYYWRNDYAGLEWEIIFKDGDRVLQKPRLLADCKKFLRIWERNIREQGFLAVQCVERLGEAKAEDAA